MVCSELSLLAFYRQSPGLASSIPIGYNETPNLFIISLNGGELRMLSFLNPTDISLNLPEHSQQMSVPATTYPLTNYFREFLRLHQFRDKSSSKLSPLTVFHPLAVLFPRTIFVVANNTTEGRQAI